MRVTAGGTLIKDGKLLLGLRSNDKTYYPNTWDVFGGHCESGETVERALIREFVEELGVTPVRYKYLGAFDEPNPETYGKGQHHLYTVYSWEGEPSNLSNEHQLIQWFTLDESTRLELASTNYIELFGKFL